MTRVLHCIHSLVSGGAERQLQLLVKGLAEDGIKPAVFCVDATGHDLAGCGVDIFQYERRSKYSIGVFQAIDRAVLEFRPEVIHAWLPGSVTIPALLIGAMRRIPTVYAYRNVMRFQRPLMLPEFVCAAAFCKQVVSNNPIIGSNRWYRWLYHRKRGREIPNAVAVGDAVRKETIELKQDRVGILFVGRITRQKNWSCLLDALKILDSQMAWSLDVCGVGEDDAAFARKVEDYGFAKRVTMHGYRADVYAMMRAADILVMPSWYEGMPNAVLEAMAIGLPCVLSDIPPHRRLVDAIGADLTFDPSNPQDLAERIVAVAEDARLRAKASEVGRAVASTYGVKAMTARYKELYEEVRGNRRRANDGIPRMAKGIDADEGADRLRRN